VPQPTPVLPSSLSEVPSAPQTPFTRVDQWRPQEQPQLTDPVGEDIYVMEQTLPYCWPGSSASICQEVDDLVLPLDDWWPPDIHALRLQLQADLVPANRRSTPVPAAALAGAQRMDGAGLRALREQGGGATVHGPTRTYDHVAYLTRPVFSVDGQWAMIAVAWIRVPTISSTGSLSCCIGNKDAGWPNPRNGVWAAYGTAAYCGPGRNNH